MSEPYPPHPTLILKKKRTTSSPTPNTKLIITIVPCHHHQATPLEEEEKVAVSFAKKADIIEALKLCHEIEYEWHKKKVIAEMLAHQEVM